MPARPPPPAVVAHMPVDRGGIGPVGLDRDDREAMFLDQPPRDRGAGAVEFGRAMAGLAKQHHPRVGIAIEQAAEAGIVEAWQQLGGVADDRGERPWFDQRVASPIIGPAVRADQGHETDVAQILLLEIVR